MDIRAKILERIQINRRLSEYCSAIRDKIEDGENRLLIENITNGFHREQSYFEHLLKDIDELAVPPKLSMAERFNAGTNEEKWATYQNFSGIWGCPKCKQIGLEPKMCSGTIIIAIRCPCGFKLTDSRELAFGSHINRAPFFGWELQS